jgi:hypothetical protein
MARFLKPTGPRYQANNGVCLRCENKRPCQISKAPAREKAGMTPAFPPKTLLLTNYCAGAGAGVAGAGSAGLVELSAGAAGFIGCSAAGGLVLWVVVLSVPLSLQAATPSRAMADKEARMSFFITSLLQYTLKLQ